MELRGSLGGSVRLFLQRDAVDGGEIGSERPHVSSTGAIVAALVARQGLEIRVLHDPRHSGSHLDFASLLAAHVMKMMAHQKQRRTSLGVALGVELPSARARWEDFLRGIRVGMTVDVGRMGTSETTPALVTELLRLGPFATWQAERAIGDHDRNTLRLRLDPQRDVTKFEPGMTVWLAR
jgi:hypothetical protein